MPRTRRIAVASYPHHIVQRGHNREAVFRSNADRRAYLQRLTELRSELDIRVYGYCLMTNHVHLIVEPIDHAEALSMFMKRLAGRHAQRINRQTGRTGSAWEGRFKCSLIETDGYLLACTRYVDLNPVRAGLVVRPEDYTWSSYRAKIGLVSFDWLDPDPCYLNLSESPESRQQRYREFVEQGISANELGFIRGAIHGNRATGSEKFARTFDQRSGDRASRRPRGRPRKIGDRSEFSEFPENRDLSPLFRR